ncbi:hypothetical protein QJS10_CPA01g02409 [Acorus calamus]|uniref:Reverse transcriptase n=1 Tax=Acorus calamus TaxID=4465 RepID=A0AAV9FP13_ACOCL|nr:hypothetical protein QJS10_CPA01g02409 [Acorus calamus]
MLWADLANISHHIGAHHWIIGGDFNEVRFSFEKAGGHPIHSRRSARFNACIEDCLLHDLRSIGGQFSWSNNQQNRIACKLDRVLVNSRWIQDFPDAYTQVLSPGFSDHSPLKHTLGQSRSSLEQAQAVLLLDPLNPLLIQSEGLAKSAYLEQLRIEESFLWQTFRQLWLSEGDKNFRFFHSMVKARIARNSIRKVQLADGSFSSDPQVVKDHAVSHFQQLLNQRPQLPCPTIVHSTLLSEEERSSLCDYVSEGEIKSALFALKPLSSPGPDGFSARFFQLFWPSIKEEFVAAISWRNLIQSVKSFISFSRKWYGPSGKKGMIEFSDKEGHMELRKG